MEKKIFKTVGEYIENQPKEVQAVLKEIRQIIRKAAPDSVELISYGMPAYKLNGKPLVYFAAFSKHIGFYPIPSGIKEFGNELKEYKHAKGSVQFPMDKPVPYALIKRIVEFRANEILSK